MHAPFTSAHVRAVELGVHPQVEVIEASGEVGGVACTLEHTFGDDRLPLNYGVQGGSAAAHQNTIELMREVGVGVAPSIWRRCAHAPKRPLATAPMRSAPPF